MVTCSKEMVTGGAFVKDHYIHSELSLGPCSTRHTPTNTVLRATNTEVSYWEARWEGCCCAV